MTPPFERQQAYRTTRHHLLFEKPEWRAKPKSKTVHELGSFIVAAVRAPHDYVHIAMKPVPVPDMPVLSFMHDLGKEYSGWQNDNNRISAMVSEMSNFAITARSPQQSHEMIQVITSIEAQMCVINLMKGIKPHNAR